MSSPKLQILLEDSKSWSSNTSSNVDSLSKHSAYQFTIKVLNNMVMEKAFSTAAKLMILDLKVFRELTVDN
jgi:hypothetical protein